MVSSSAITSAYEVISKNLVKTPLVRSANPFNTKASKTFLKLENKQYSGSFKIRGVTNAFRFISQVGNSTIVAASTGNHAAAVMYRCKEMGLDCILFVPKSVSEAKLKGMEGATEINIIGEHCGETEIIAKDWALERGLPFIHPYADERVIIGQGTIGPELASQIEMEEVDRIFIPIGGGGLISGIGTYIKHTFPSIQIIGCQPLQAAEMHDSVKKGRVVEPYTQDTLSDATAGGLDPSSATFPICCEVIDDFVLLSEEEIKLAVYNVNRYEGQVIEPSAALSYAGLHKYESLETDTISVAVLTGSKISIPLFEAIKSEYDRRET